MSTGKNSWRDSSFNAAERLAIINVLLSFGYFLDEMQMENYFGLFTDSATIEAWFDNKKIFEGQHFQDETAKRRERFKSGKIQRRHVISPPRFDEQTDDTACGQIYFRIYQTVDGGEVTLGIIGVYEFAVVKRQGQWYIDRWIVQLDSKPDHI
ncbi:MAG: nuclear transport factor 2 family protein [Georgfuchsia sp.]